MHLKDRAFSAVRWTTTAAVARAGLQVLQIAVLARLLAPEDFGLMAMVGVILSFGAVFADLGLNSAYLQRAEVSPEQRSSLFWLNLLLSLALMGLVMASSPLLAGFFGDARLIPLLMLASTTFVIGALGQQVRVSAEKALAFRAVMQVEMVAALAGFVAAVAGALAGLGVYALVLGGIVSAAVGTVLAWRVLAAGWRPLRRFSLADVRPFLGFGGALVGDAIANQIHRSLDLFFGGRMLAATQLGLYSLPRELVLRLQFMVNPIVTRVGFPLIAQVQADIPRVRAIYLRTLNMTASTNAPLYVGLAFFAPEMVWLLFGAQWSGSAELLRILALWGFLRSTVNPVGSLLLGMGRADLSFKWNLGLLILIPPVLWVCAYFGPTGLAWGLLGLQFTLYIPAWRILVYPLCGAGLAEYADAALRPFALAALAIAPAFLAVAHLDGWLARLLIGAGIGAALYGLLSYWFNRGWVAAMLELAQPGRNGIQACA